nr:uncharacterized protein LOC111836354 isoform X2 [Paramormyrops kingsleyae]
MPFESKHGYFKRCARHFKYFKNICLTFSERHQFQASLSAGPGGTQLLQVKDSSTLYLNFYGDKIKHVVSDFGFSEIQYKEMTDLQQTFLCAAITEVLPTLPDGSKGILEETLQSLGLETYDDFQFIEEADLLSALKPIQARKVLAAWKLKCQSPESKGSSVHLVVPHQDLPQLCSVFHPDIQPLQAAVKVLI